MFSKWILSTESGFANSSWIATDNSDGQWQLSVKVFLENIRYWPRSGNPGKGGTYGAFGRKISRLRSFSTRARRMYSPRQSKW
jgi:hypothetical protein